MVTNQTMIEKRYCELIKEKHDIRILSHTVYSPDASLVDVINTFECLCPLDCKECRTCKNNW